MPLNNDYIELNNIITSVYLGITSQEQSKMQDILLNIKLYKNLHKPGLSDNIHDTINYADVIDFIYQELPKTKFGLIEAIAEHLISQIKNIFSPMAIEIEISKINPPLNHFPDCKISIHIYRKFKEG
ncbi:MAG: dihydroneopterin aldolase [Dehalococcoidia bacterium]